MAGIYIHIPFCKQKCYYCDFYKTLNTGRVADFVAALKKEATERKDYLEGEPLETVYLGGGTPSVLKEEEIECIFSFLDELFHILPGAEITFESNPDDLSPEYLQSLKNSGVNRLSIGVQSFNDEHLKRMNRRHSGRQAADCIGNALSAGFTDISTDLIYGLPGLTRKLWKETLNTMFRFPVSHLSAYHLTYHEGTPFYRWVQAGEINELSEKESLAQFNLLLDESAKAGFEHYEISNFARHGMYARHNTAYWTGKAYLGLGPSAHSFNGSSRRWNVASVETYIHATGNGECFWEEEQLTDSEKFNEYILTHLRTRWGVAVEDLKSGFGEKQSETFMKQAGRFVNSGKMQEEAGVYTLTRDGLFVSDDLIAEFMII